MTSGADADDAGGAAEIEAFLFELAEGRDLLTGGHLVVDHRGSRIVDVVVGQDAHGRPAAATDVHAAYCALKPVIAITLLRQLDEAGIDPDQPATAVLGWLEGSYVGECSFTTLLNHSSGLHEVPTVWLSLQADVVRREACRLAVPPVGWSTMLDLGYCEALPWEVVVAAIGALGDGAGFGSVARTAVLEPLGVDEVWLGGLARTVAPERIAVSSDLAWGAAIPVSYESDSMRSSTDPVLGNYASCAGLAAFYRSVLDVRAGRREVAPSLARAIDRSLPDSTGIRFDHTMGESCAYGRGWMVDLTNHRFGDGPTAASFGHTGRVGVLGGMADPTHDLVVAFSLGSLTAESLFARFWRPRLFGRIYDALGLPRAGAAVGADRRTERRRSDRRRRRAAAVPNITTTNQEPPP